MHKICFMREGSFFETLKNTTASRLRRMRSFFNRRADRAHDFFNGFPVFALGHDPDQGLGPGRAHQNPPGSGQCLRRVLNRAAHGRVRKRQNIAVIPDVAQDLGQGLEHIHACTDGASVGANGVQELDSTLESIACGAIIG